MSAVQLFRSYEDKDMATPRIVKLGQRALWWLAGADASVLGASDMTESQRLKYSAIGLCVSAITVLAFLGWFHQGTLLFAELKYAFLLGGVMAGVMLLWERLLVITLRPTLSPQAKILAFIWRGSLASVNALILALPFALHYFTHDIDLMLDTEKLALMTQKHAQVEQVFGLPALSTALGDLTTAMATNRTLREQLPAPAQQDVDQGKACDADYTTLRAVTLPKITYAQRQLHYIWMTGDDPSAYARARARQLGAEIASWRATLAAKKNVCGGLWQTANDAVAAYHTERDNEYDGLRNQQGLRQVQMKSAIEGSTRTLQRTDRVIELHAIPDLGAQVRALFLLLLSDGIARAVFLLAFAFSFWLDMMAVIAKLSVHPAEPYGRVVLAQEAKLAAVLDAEVSVAQARASMQTDEVQAEQSGVRRFYEADGRRTYGERAEDRARHDTKKAAFLATFDEADALMSRYAETQQRLDELRKKWGTRGDPQSLEEIDSVARAALHRAAGHFKSDWSFDPAE